MIAEELINHLIPALSLNDDAEKALNRMEELHLRQLPVVDNSIYQGLVSEDRLLELEDINHPLSEFHFDNSSVFVTKHQHFFEVFKQAGNHNTDVLAVLDDKQHYLGCITVLDMAMAFAKTLSIQSPGGILTLSMFERDYSLTEISRLIESNDAKILGILTEIDPDNASKIKLTLKINHADLGRVISTLERFNYTITAQFHKSEVQHIDKERLDILLKYLSI